MASGEDKTWKASIRGDQVEASGMIRTAMDRGEFFLRSGERTILRDNSYSHWPQKNRAEKVDIYRDFVR